MKENIKPSVFAFNDFRMFLAEYQKERIAREPGFSKSEFSRLLQLPNTRSYVTDVLNGKKVTDTFVERFVAVIGFNREEAQYFRTLVRFNQAENIDEKELFFSQLIDLNRTPGRMLDTSMLRYYQSWHNGVIRALLAVENFTGDCKALAKKIYPPMTVKDVRTSMKLLLELGLIKKNEQGVYKPADSAIQAPEKMKTELLKQYQLQSLLLAQKTVAGPTSRIAFSHTNTISISRKGNERLVNLLEKFRSQVRSLAHKDEEQPDRVLQLSIVLGNHYTQEPHHE